MNILKWLYKRKLLQEIQEEIWGAEMIILLQDAFKEEVKTKTENFQGRIKDCEKWLTEHEDSYKHEDREARKKIQEELANWKKILAEQEEEIKKSDKTREKSGNAIIGQRNKAAVIREKFR